MRSEETAAALSAERRKRVNKLKKMIIWIVILIISASLIACGMSLARLFAAQKRIKILEEENKKLIEENAELTAQLEKSVAEMVDVEVSEAMPKAEEPPQEAQTEQPADNVKHVYLTFDDGPSENTGVVLDILKQYNAKATFFVIGKTDQASLDLYKRIVAEGHSLGIHSYTHKYTQVYASLESFQNDVLSLQAHLKEVTGQDVRLYRFPGGSSNKVSKVPIEDCIRFLSENGFTYYDWNATNGDATGREMSIEEMVSSVTMELDKYQNLTVLMHDGAGKQKTVEALPHILEQLQAQGAQMLPITDSTTPVQHKKVESVMGGQ